VIYPARGIADLWLAPDRRPSEALGDLLGRTRAELLLALAEPATTSGLARRHALSASVVSSHLGSLRRAGLASAHRSGREVWYEATPLGQALVTAAARA
jgi:DNA-binding transcriptional ArsR family regulator